MNYVSPHRDPHESCPQPQDGTAKVWRYLDLERLIALLSSRELIFPRADSFRDEFEGSVTRGVSEFWARNPISAEMMARSREEFRRMAYVSCWHMNNSESEAMWRLYCPTNAGVALQTTYERLDRS